jgi:hypothetical protein
MKKIRSSKSETPRNPEEHPSSVRDETMSFPRIVYRGHRGLIAISLLLVPGPKARAQETPPIASLSQARVEASGRREVILNVREFGRYAVLVKSANGSAIQLVDRMAGPGSLHGRPGEANGRIDAFLDRGEYKIVVWSHELGTGEAALEVHPFVERNTEPLRLVEEKPLSLELDDFESRSYWLEIRERRRVVLEAAGRNLGDLHLWKDGTWLVDATPTVETIAPKVGRPLTLCRLTTWLEPGLYRLAGYGGESLPWAEQSAQHPFHLRYGVPSLGVAGRRAYEVSPFGFDRYLISARASFFRIELAEARSATLHVSPFDAEQPFLEQGPRGEVTKESLPPVAELQLAVDPSATRIVTVSSESGQPYVLQHFERGWVYAFEGSGDYWLSTIHSGHPADSIDATGIVVAHSRNTAKAQQAIELSRTAGWAQRANLLDRMTVFLDVTELGRYEILSRGTEARFRIEPFLINPPADYQPPPFQGTEWVWKLDPGLHVLTVEPVDKGILDVAIKPVAFLDTLLSWVGLGTPEAKRAVRASVRFPSLTLSTKVSYSLVLNQQPGVQAGVVLRKLPLDLREPLPLTPRPEETVDVSFEAPEAGFLTARTETGALLPVSLDGSDWTRQVEVKPGSHHAAVRNDQRDTLVYSLHLEPARVSASTPLPRFDEIAENAHVASLPVLTETEPRFFDLAPNENRSFLVRADAPALYQLQTTGLLATEGNLRTRTVVSFRRQAENGVGRNFLIQQYLREGDYQVTVTPQGYSTGRVGLRLERTALVDGGELVDGMTARATLAPGEAISYALDIREGGIYHLETVGLGRSFLARLEDDDGWPIEPPNQQANYTRRFEPGRYRLLLLPEPVETRRVTRLEMVRPTARLEGHGPHPLGLDSTIRHVWMEPEEDAPREPDVWEFSLPATVHASIGLTAEMEGRLLRSAPEGDSEEVSFIPPGRGYQGELSEGLYRLEVVCSRENSGVEYELALSTAELVAGVSRAITAPAVIPIAVGPQSLSELSSFFTADVRATLLDAEDNAIAWSDDRPDDWNFQILERLPPGRYSLRVEPVGTGQASTVVSFRAPREVERERLELPARREIQLGDDVELIPLELPAAVTPEALAIVLSSPETIGAAIETATESGFRSVASSMGNRVELAVPLGRQELRLRLWSSDKRGSRTVLEALAFSPPRFSEEDAASGITLVPVSEALGAAGVTLDSGGVFGIDAPDVRWASEPLRPFEPSFNGLALPTGNVVWLLGRPGDEVTLTRARIGAETVLALHPDRPVEIDLDQSSGGPVVVMARSFSGQPSVQASSSMSVGPGSALSVALERSRASVFVSEAPGTRPVETRVRAVSFSEPDPAPGGWGAIEGRLAGLEARAFDLPDGEKLVSLALDEATAAVLSSGGEVESVHWHGGLPFEETLSTKASRLTFLHYGEGERSFVAQVLPSGTAGSELSEGAPFQEEFARAGTYRLVVAPGASSRRVQVSGAAEDANFVGARGRVLRGSELPIEDESGYLLVHHRPGTVVAWIESEETRASDTPSVNPIDIALPARPSLSGSVSRFRLALPEPVVFHLRTTTPVATLINDELRFHPDGAAVTTFLPRGASEFEIRAIGDGVLSGEAEMTTSAVLAIGEGLGPEVLLPAGSTRVFSFEVSRAGSVGVGVRASTDVVSTILFDESGRTLGRGVVQMHELSPGRYLLAIESPSDAPAVTARPAVAGIEPPSTGPPSEVIRRYIESGNPR